MQPAKNSVQVCGLITPKATMIRSMGRSRKCVNVGTDSARGFYRSGVNFIHTRWVNALSRGLSVKDLSAAAALLGDIEARLRQRTDLAGEWGVILISGQN